MEESKKKQIEDRLRQMIAAENQPAEEKRAMEPSPARSRVTVIRRRKGVPDTQIAS